MWRYCEQYFLLPLRCWAKRALLRRLWLKGGRGFPGEQEEHRNLWCQGNDLVIAKQPSLAGVDAKGTKLVTGVHLPEHRLDSSFPGFFRNFSELAKDLILQQNLS